MQAYELNIAGRDLLLALAESGPGYQLIELLTGDINIPAGRYIVFNTELLIEMNDFVQFLTGNDPQSQLFTNYAAFKAGITITPIAHLPSAPTPTPPSAPAPWPVSLTLVATSITIGSEVFWRLCSVNPDPRLRGGVLVPGTYLTSDDDLKLANTGFGVVGRYALPSPFPASYVTVCRPTVGETFNIGTTRPNFGQAGGGVEILFQSYSVPATYQRKMPEW
jgi:hypothetical protein